MTKYYSITNRIISAILIAVFLFTQCGMGIAAPAAGHAENLRKSQEGAKANGNIGPVLVGEANAVARGADGRNAEFPNGSLDVSNVFNVNNANATARPETQVVCVGIERYPSVKRILKQSKLISKAPHRIFVLIDPSLHCQAESYIIEEDIQANVLSKKIGEQPGIGDSVIVLSGNFFNLSTKNQGVLLIHELAHLAYPGSSQDSKIRMNILQSAQYNELVGVALSHIADFWVLTRLLRNGHFNEARDYIDYKLDGAVNILKDNGTDSVAVNSFNFLMCYIVTVLPFQLGSQQYREQYLSKLITIYSPYIREEICQKIVIIGEEIALLLDKVRYPDIEVFRKAQMQIEAVTFAKMPVDIPEHAASLRKVSKSVRNALLAEFEGIESPLTNPSMGDDADGGMPAREANVAARGAGMSGASDKEVNANSNGDVKRALIELKKALVNLAHEYKDEREGAESIFINAINNQALIQNIDIKAAIKTAIPILVGYMVHENYDVRKNAEFVLMCIINNQILIQDKGIMEAIKTVIPVLADYLDPKNDGHVCWNAAIIIAEIIDNATLINNNGIKTAIETVIPVLLGYLASENADVHHRRGIDVFASIIKTPVFNMQAVNAITGQIAKQTDYHMLVNLVTAFYQRSCDGIKRLLHNRFYLKLPHPGLLCNLFYNIFLSQCHSLSPLY